MPSSESPRPLPIAGRLHDSRETVDVLSPWDGALVAKVGFVGAAETQAAVDAAAAAMDRPLPAFERAAILDGAARIVADRREELAELLAREVGKPISQGRVEVDRCVQTLIFSAAEARTLTGEGIAFDAHPAGVGRRGYTIRVPIGVIGAITPFNFPLNLAAHKVGPAVAAGCGVVLKPTREAPLLALELADILYESGLPREWLSVVVGPSKEIADVLVDDPRVAMLTFTGSSEVGWDLAARAPRKRVALELGNSTPVLVCADADLDAAAAAVAGSAFAFAGQSCISVQRVLVQEGVHEEFVDRLIKATQQKKVGDPLDDETDVGPLINQAALQRVLEWLDEATERGWRDVRQVVHSQRAESRHLDPVVLDGVDTSVRVWSDEVFGPVVSVRGFDDVDEAIALANDTEYGLQAGIFTRDLATAIEASEKLQFGGVTINETPTFRVDQMPYGGTKESGNTREGPHFTVREMTEERTVVIRI